MSAEKQLCRWCGKPFKPRRWDQAYCSKECKAERQRITGRKALIGALPLPLREKLAGIDEIRERNMELSEALLKSKETVNSLKALLKREREQTEALAAERDSLKRLYRSMQQELMTLRQHRQMRIEPVELRAENYCERLRLRQTSPLPCGKHLQCFRPVRCGKLSSNASEKDIPDQRQSFGTIPPDAPHVSPQDVFTPTYGQEF